MIPPGGVSVFSSMPTAAKAAELSTAPWLELWISMTGLSGK